MAHSVLSASVCLQVLWNTVWGALAALFSYFWPFRAKPPDLSADVCVVTGAGQGLGRHIALQLAECGATLALWDVDGGKVERVAREIRESGGTATAYVVDCSKREEVYRAADRVRNEVGDAAVLVNNAGIVGLRGSYVGGALSDEMIVKTFSVNALAHYWTVRAFLPWMMDNNYGYVVNIASFAAYVGTPQSVAYAATKAAVRSFSDSLRYELVLAGKRGVTVTCVYPSMINTTMVPKATLEAAKKIGVPVSEPEYVAKTILLGMGEQKADLIVPASNKVTLFLKAVLPRRAFDSLLCKTSEGLIRESGEKYLNT
jgi:all-trans-retinol dehydrogenase (NAD+)